MKRTVRSFGTAVAFLLGLVACSEHPGYEEREGVYWKLEAFGEQGPTLALADASILRVKLSGGCLSSPIEYQLYQGRIRARQDSGSAVDSALIRLLLPMRGGDRKSFFLPYRMVDSTIFDSFGKASCPADGEMQLDVAVERSFDEGDFITYLMNAAQQSELTEEEAIGLYFLNHRAEDAEQHGSVFIERLDRLPGDSIRAGSEVVLEYRSYLLNGTPLDVLTTMTFQFGRPGQLVPGLQYGLSFLCEGEKARIFMPSGLAFGEDGSTTGIVPARTPVYFSVHIREVKTPEEMMAGGN